MLQKQEHNMTQKTVAEIFVETLVAAGVSLTANEITEIFLQTAIYCGVPAGDGQFQRCLRTA
jgi:hypothetical protein